MDVKVLFTEEECFYINNALKNERIQKLTKQNALNIFAFAREVSPEDNDIIRLIEGTYSKISTLSDEQWEDLKKLFPLTNSIENIDIEEERK